LQQTAENKAIRLKTFEDLRIIKPILKAINDVHYIKPTPIQQIAIPIISSGKDVVASSITGSGKTAAFLVPIIQRYYNVAAVGYIRSLIVTPTR
jgi:superfamily II DNA/RNA helicase